MLFAEILHLGVVALLTLFGNLFLIIVMRKKNALSKQKVSPVQVALNMTCSFYTHLFQVASVTYGNG